MKEVLLADLLTGSLSRAADEPLQKQIYEIVRRGVLDHTLAAGQRLPSSRALAEELGVSRITVTLAYERLIAESYLSARGGSGTFVEQTVDKPLRTAGAPDLIEHERPALSARGAITGSGTGGLGQHTGAFVPGIADASLFPFHIWRRLVSRHLNKSNLELAGYAKDGAGFLPLRMAIANYLRLSRSVVCEPAQIIVTAGTHQSVDLCARLLAESGDSALVESPCHWAFAPVLGAAGLRTRAARLDDQGIDIAASPLPRRARMVITSPSHQYPTGVIMPLARRLELLQQARARSLWVLEDDYDSEFRYDAAPIPSLQGLDADGRVIYMGTFSKTMFAGLRLSYMVVPEHVAHAFSNACARIYRPGHLHLQAALADFMNDGHFSHNIKRMRLEYAQRQSVLREALERRIGEPLRLSQARAGLHVYARLGPEICVQALADAARAEALVLGMPHFLDDDTHSDRQAVVLGYGGVPSDHIEEGVSRLARSLEHASRKTRSAAKRA
ncbi:PLP-dependent aminotransferase family protein [Bordetella avium]|uniref:GntR-family transcriptional regulator n=1 Tax=Bordetella avium (strain 197N) TaxID=360910 RepID=Q2KYW3_BORA1|nr:PLP-dependent aminotransferase family protein [Bordetella avium]AZY51405.1 PLP-dependent aminotransferase family protein [Bordetella avium]RIQ16846.1 PLP-dependent aminotransferase family protein [Bordetella avium]RIQ35181.1 PLP-dependent aminotransferase family protein [Bordetella avium]RIQ49527.1 PLP-dependent aminotransferase family protein [Bordetella avium]RIQ74602.1 PLP-dependent aminotransferase family protein [Bordetella avium]